MLKTTLNYLILISLVLTIYSYISFNHMTSLYKTSNIKFNNYLDKTEPKLIAAIASIQAQTNIEDSLSVLIPEMIETYKSQPCNNDVGKSNCNQEVIILTSINTDLNNKRYDRLQNLYEQYLIQKNYK